MESVGTESVVTKYNRLAMDCVASKDYDQALELLQEARALIHQPQACVPNSLKAMTLNNLGCIFKRLLQHTSALNSFQEALVYEQTDMVSLGGTYLNVCAIYSLQRKHQEALQYALKAVAAFQQTQLLSSSAVAHYNAGLEYQHLGDASSAKESLTTALDLALQHLGSQNEFTKRIRNALNRAKAPPRNLSLPRVSGLKDRFKRTSLTENTPPFSISRPPTKRPHLTPMPIMNARMPRARRNLAPASRNMWDVDTTPWSKGRPLWRPPGVSAKSAQQLIPKLRRKPIQASQKLEQRLTGVKSSLRKHPTMQYDNTIHFIENKLSHLKSKLDNFEQSYLAKDHELRKRAAVCIQVFYRAYRLRQKHAARPKPADVATRNSAAVQIQKNLKMFVVRRIYHDIRAAVCLIQRFYRRYRRKTSFK